MPEPRADGSGPALKSGREHAILPNMSRIPLIPRVPPWVVGVSLAALLLPPGLHILAPTGMTGPLGLAVWGLLLVPAFTLTYHLGWAGGGMTLAAGAATIVGTHALVAAQGAAAPDWRWAGASLAVLTGISLGTGLFAELLHRQRALAERTALIDPLTGLPNRRHATLVLEMAFAAARRGEALSVILLDLDRFKWLNEQHGNAAGDEVLRGVGHLFSGDLLPGETVARWGGEQFLLILPGVDGPAAADRAEALRRAVSGAPFRWQPLTASAGIATFRAAMGSADTLVGLADEALLRAKEAGRDRSVALDFGAPASHPAAVVLDPGGALPLGDAASAPAADPDALHEARIVVIDDEEVNLRSFRRALNALGFGHVATYRDPTEGLAAILDAPPDLVLLDICMEPLDGFDVLDRLSPLLRREGYLPILILTGERSPEIRERALRAGGRDFLNKPVDLTELEARILNLLETRALHRQLRDARDRLEERVVARTRELEDARVEILRRLARAAEYRDDATGRHQERVGILSALLAARMGLDGDTVSVLRLAAPLHDLGKIAISDQILHKPGPLTADEYHRMRDHTVKGAELLAGSPHRVLEVARIIALTHHERWDGQGYPNGVRGDEIPMVGRIVSVADVFDSLTHRRVYKEAFTVEATMRYVREARSRAFDPRVVDALEDLYATGQLDAFAGDDAQLVAV